MGGAGHAIHRGDFALRLLGPALYQNIAIGAALGTVGGAAWYWGVSIPNRHAREALYRRHEMIAAERAARVAAYLKAAPYDDEVVEKAE